MDLGSGNEPAERAPEKIGLLVGEQSVLGCALASQIRPPRARILAFVLGLGGNLVRIALFGPLRIQWHRVQVLMVPDHAELSDGRGRRRRAGNHRYCGPALVEERTSRASHHY